MNASFLIAWIRNGRSLKLEISPGQMYGIVLRKRNMKSRLSCLSAIDIFYTKIRTCHCPLKKSKEKRSHFHKTHHHPYLDLQTNPTSWSYLMGKITIIFLFSVEQRAFPEGHSEPLSVSAIPLPQPASAVDTLPLRSVDRSSSSSGSDAVHARHALVLSALCRLLPSLRRSSAPPSLPYSQLCPRPIQPIRLPLRWLHSSGSCSLTDRQPRSEAE